MRAPPGPRASSPSPADAPAGETPALPDARARTTELLNEGLQIARALGMRPLMERILGHRQILKA